MLAIFLKFIRPVKNQVSTALFYCIGKRAKAIALVECNYSFHYLKVTTNFAKQKF